MKNCQLGVIQDSQSCNSSQKCELLFSKGPHGSAQREHWEMSPSGHKVERDFSQMNNAYTNVHASDGAEEDACWDPFSYDKEGRVIGEHEQQELLHQYQQRREHEHPLHMQYQQHLDGPMKKLVCA